MNVLFTKEVLDDEVCWSDLDAILYRIRQGAHEWDTQNQDEIANSSWFTGLRQDNKKLFYELFESIVKNGAWTQGSKSDLHFQCLTVAGTSDVATLRLDPASAVYYLNQPLLLIVENEFTDGLFLKTVLNVLGSPALQDYVNHGDWIRIDGSGGIGELPKFVRQKRSEADQRQLPLRCFVMFDQDGCDSQTLDKHVRLIKEACDTHAVPYHLLRKRTIENYIPDAALEAGGYGREKVAALKRLTREQRDCFKLKRGLQGLQKPQEKTLFADLPEDVCCWLQDGRECIEVFTPQASGVTPESLRERDGVGELDQLVKTITRLI